jgi:hypothetical protein
MTEAALNTDPDAALGKLTVEDVSCWRGRVRRSGSDLFSAWVSLQDVTKTAVLDPMAA